MSAAYSPADDADWDEDLPEDSFEEVLDESKLSFFLLDESDDLVSLFSLESDFEDDPSSAPLGLRA